MSRILARLRNRYLFAVDAISLVMATLLAFTLRFEGLEWPDGHRFNALVFLAVSVPVRLWVFYLGGLYRRLWVHASVGELERIAVVGVAAAAVSSLLGVWLLPAFGLTHGRVPIGVLAIDALLTVLLPASPRFLARVLTNIRHQRGIPDSARRVLIAGAGSTGQLIVKEMFRNPQLGMVPVGFVDDDVRKHHHVLAEIPVWGALDRIPELVSALNIEEVVIAMPTASGAKVREIVKAASEAGTRTRTVPGLFEILSGRIGISNLRQVQIQDLLRREPVQTDLNAVAELVADRVVLVTGAGGSIGSELCRQIAGLSPSRLVLLGHGENSIFDVQQELRETFSDLPMTAVIADVRDRARIFAIFERHRPFAVFHAAAHKHVPLMEENIAEAVTNNVLGTKNVVEAADHVGTQHFVMISTDKVVRPTSVMGATKRIAEQVVQWTAREGQHYVAVRFGNVLGSRGSVVPTFLRQIRAGGPVTVTHPEMRRFFMTIPEAVQLVMQAAAIGRGREVFVLDMGEPVRVVDLAQDLIRLSGLQVGVDVELRFTGMRPGEKLYEEMFFDDEHASPTSHPKVLKAKNTSLAAETPRLIDQLLDAAARGAPAAELRSLLYRLVPDFQRPHLTLEPNDRDSESTRASALPA